MNETVNIGRTIARERRRMGITQEALAAHLGVSKAAVSKWELEQSLPDVSLLPRIAAYFSLSLDELFDWRGEFTEAEAAALSRPSLVVVKGPNGSGKSTLLKILLGEVRGWAGEVFVDGTPLGEISPDSWHARCAAVRQRPFLLNASLRENVLLGADGADEKAYRAALAASGLDEVAARLPEGDASPVGPAGSLLSGGERQRVAIARALLRGADVLFLDEPATGLDLAAKASLRSLLVCLAREHLVIVVDHEELFDSVANQIIKLEPPRKTPS